MAPKSGRKAARCRAFVALALPGAVRQTVLQAQTRLKQTTGSVRWVDPDHFHVTLKFLGEVDLAGLDRLVDRLTARLVCFGPVPVGVDGVGAFPSAMRPRVVWTGLTDPVRVQRLASLVEEAASDCGYAPEDRPFHGHVTLGRVKRPGDLPDLLQNTNWGDVRSETASVDRVTLFRSRLGAGGPVYSVLYQVQLR